MPSLILRTLSFGILSLGLLPTFVLGQDSLSTITPKIQKGAPSPVYIDEILIEGNEITKDYIILREMSLKVGDTLDVEAANFDKNRIYSLGLFNRVELAYAVQEDKAKLHVLVDERWYLFPFPIIGIKDRDWKKLYYGLGLLHFNFRGRNEKIMAAFALGYDPFVSLRYRNPLLSQESNFFLDSRIFYSRVRNRSLVSQRDGDNFDENHYGVEGTIGKRLDLYRSVFVTAGYQVLTVSHNRAGRTLSPSGRDAYISGTVGFLYDTRDLLEYPSRGTFLGLWVTKYGFGETVVNYARGSVDLRKFVPVLDQVTVAGRVFANAAAGETVPNYGHVFFGYTERIRGHFSEVYEGENIFGTSLEIRVPLIPVRFLNVEKIPIPKFGLWRFGVYGTIFGDAGKVWYRNDPFALQNLVKGYGLGLNFLLPYSSVFRVEYALNELRRGEIIFDLSASF